jgi:peroxiredoxin Q/BCP
MTTLTDGLPIPKSISSLVLSTNRGQAKLSEFLGHQLVIYFYPKDDTPGCTIEGKEFSARHSDFLSADTQIIGVSRDSLASHERFIAKHGLSIILVADTSESMCKAFGVIKEKNMYGKKVMGIERSTFLLDAHGVLRRSWRGVKVPGHVDEVLAVARG